MAWSLEQAYDTYPRIEEQFEAALDVSLDPHSSGQLFDIVAAMGLPPGAVAIDVGCGEGAHTIELARRFGLSVTGVDPVPRHVEVAREAVGNTAADDTAAGDIAVTFELGSAEQLPAVDASVDLVWCRDVLVHIADLDRVYAEFRRVLKPGGRVLVYQMFAGDLLEPREAAWLWDTMGVVPSSAEPAVTDAAIAGAGLNVDEFILVGSEWGEWAQEHNGKPGRKLMHASRLLRAPDSYVEQYGRDAYDMMFGDCLWQIYGMIGKLSRRIYVLSRALG